jgi:hypothetical protein
MERRMLMDEGTADAVYAKIGGVTHKLSIGPEQVNGDPV